MKTKAHKAESREINQTKASGEFAKYIRHKTKNLHHKVRTCIRTKPNPRHELEKHSEIHHKLISITKPNIPRIQ